MPILDCNVIEELVKMDRQEVESPSGFGILSSLKAAFVNGGESQLEALINLIQTPDDDYQCSVRTPKRDTVIPNGQAVKVSCRASTGIREGDTESDAATPEVDMTGLTMQQQEVVRRMLKEEAASFAKNDDDIGCIADLQMDIDLSDSTPFQRNYVSIPRPLYQEVRHYIEDLLNKQFITKSRSSYSSPVVCVRKKDGTLRLCVIKASYHS